VTRTRDPVPGLALNLDGVVLSEVFEDAVEIVDDGGSVSASFGGVNTGNLLVRDIWGGGRVRSTRVVTLSCSASTTTVVGTLRRLGD
jgi:hypothetical protein